MKASGRDAPCASTSEWKQARSGAGRSAFPTPKSARQLLTRPTDQVAVALFRNFEFKLPLEWLLATPVTSTAESGNGKPMVPVATRLRLRFSLWQNGLPADALPVEGWMELPLLSEEDLIAQQ